MAAVLMQQCFAHQEFVRQFRTEEDQQTASVAQRHDASRGCRVEFCLAKRNSSLQSCSSTMQEHYMPIHVHLSISSEASTPSGKAANKLRTYSGDTVPEETAISCYSELRGSINGPEHGLNDLRVCACVVTRMSGLFSGLSS